MKVKWYSEMEMAQENDYSHKESFYWVVSWPLLLSGGESWPLLLSGGELTFQEDKNLMEEVYWGKFFQMGGMSKFSASGGTTTMPTVGKTLWSIICTVIKLSIKNLIVLLNWATQNDVTLWVTNSKIFIAILLLSC